MSALWPSMDINELALPYDREIIYITERLVPVRRWPVVVAPLIHGSTRSVGRPRGSHALLNGRHDMLIRTWTTRRQQ